MRGTAILAAVPLLVLTWLLVRGLNADAEMFDRALGTLDDFSAVESSLVRDVLAARAGLLRNYDPLVRKTDRLRGFLACLHEVAGTDPEIVAATDRLIGLVVRQEELVEEFKTDNALLQNSLAYFGIFSIRLDAPGQDAALAADIGALAAAVLHLTLDTSADTARDVEGRLDALVGRSLPAGDEVPLRALLAHARMLHDLLPATDGVLKTLFTLPIGRDQGVIRASMLRHQLASRERARDFRVVLYGISVILLGLLIHLGLQLRARALSLKRRAAFEHLIAGISMRFIAARRQQIGDLVIEALALLGAQIGADRGYILLGGPARRRYVWNRVGTTYPWGWPDRALALSGRFPPTDDGIVHVRHVEHLPSGPDKNGLVAAGLDSWACVYSRGSEGHVDILGFDALRPSRMARSEELGLLRMAFDAIANAVEREHLERERIRLEERLQQARRMETVGALASGIAHNFNNIIGAILGYAEMAEAQLGQDSRPARNLGEIRRAGERARDLVGQILAYGRRRAASRWPVHLQSLVAETASLLRASLPTTIVLAIREAQDPIMVLGEPAQIQQVILNLCHNAAQAMDGAGSIGIDLEIHDIPQVQALSHGILTAGRHARLTVSDTGHGIDPEILDHLFEPFSTLRTDGNGLGLATVREIVREHGGAIDVATRAGMGTRFDIWLPCIEAAGPAQDPQEDGTRRLFLGQGEAVMLVHDDRRLLLRDEEMLAALGYEAIGFTSAIEALAACRESPDRFDMMIVSHSSSAREALALAASLHEIAPRRPILLAISSAERIDADALAAAGVSEVVRRPFTSANVASALKSAGSRQAAE
jgi:signal transduction histidine kinase/BarA-like signal transduction histidine kinase